MDGSTVDAHRAIWDTVPTYNDDQTMDGHIGALPQVLRMRLRRRRTRRGVAAYIAQKGMPTATVAIDEMREPIIKGSSPKGWLSPRWCGRRGSRTWRPFMVQRIVVGVSSFRAHNVGKPTNLQKCPFHQKKWPKILGLKVQALDLYVGTRGVVGGGRTFRATIFGKIFRSTT